MTPGNIPLSVPPDRTGPRAPSLKPPAFRTARTIGAMILREMGSTYGRSPGGYVWAIASPVGSIMVMSLAFSLLIHAPALGTSFTLFYATGYLPFNFYSQLSSKIAAALRYSRPLLAYPGVTWVDAVLARYLLNVLTFATVFSIVIFGIMTVVDTRSLIDITPILGGMLLMSLIGLGVGIVNCLLLGFFPVWERIWGIASQPLFLASGVFFLYDDLPKPVQAILWWNPLAHGIAWVRTGFYPTYHASFVNLPYAFGVALTLIATGLVFLRQGYRATLER